MEFPFFYTPLSCRRVKVMGTLFLWFSLCFQEDEYEEDTEQESEENEVQEDIPPQVEEVEKIPQGAQGDQVPIVGGGDAPP